jgi:hypothetical protein
MWLVVIGLASLSTIVVLSLMWSRPVPIDRSVYRSTILPPSSSLKGSARDSFGGVDRDILFGLLFV